MDWGGGEAASSLRGGNTGGSSGSSEMANFTCGGGTGGGDGEEGIIEVASSEHRGRGGGSTSFPDSSPASSPATATTVAAVTTSFWSPDFSFLFLTLFTAAYRWEGLTEVVGVALADRTDSHDAAFALDPLMGGKGASPTTSYMCGRGLEGGGVLTRRLPER